MKLHPWNTPFTKNMSPSVGLFVEHGDDETDLVSAVVAPQGIDKYPKYLVRFGNVMEFSCYEEGCSPVRGYEDLLLLSDGICSFTWFGSPSVESYQPLVGEEALNHYLIIGADNILEVVSKNIPKITTLEKSTKIVVGLRV